MRKKTHRTGQYRSTPAKRKLRKLKLSLSECQNYLCAYCNLPMFVDKIETLEDFSKKYKINKLIVKRNLSYSCDHVDPRQGETYDNIVMAHGYCNSFKQDRDAEWFYNFILPGVKNNTYKVCKWFKKYKSEGYNR